MKNLELKQIEQIQGGYDQETCMGTSIALMSVGIAFAFTGAGAALIWGGALLGLACAD
ncbi:hypothetical protein [Lutibacter sp.]